MRETATSREEVVENVTIRSTETSLTRSARRRTGRGRRAPVPRWRQLLGKRVLAVVVVAVVLAVLVSGADAFASAGRVHQGVSVGGVDIGGKMPSDAVAELKAQLPKKANRAVTVASRDETWTVSFQDIDGSFDYAGLVEEAMAIGRSGRFVASARERARAWFGGVELPAPATADPDKLAAVIGKVSTALNVAPKDATVVVDGDDLKMKPSATGLAVDERALTVGLLGAYTVDGSRTVSVKVDTAQPRIDDEAARSAQAIAEKMLSDPAKMSYKKKSWTLSVAELGKMIEFKAVETSGSPTSTWSLVPVISSKKASKIVIPKVGAALGTPPKNARFVTRAGSVRIIPSEDGVGPDVEDFAANLTSVLKSSDQTRTVELKTKITPPKLTTEAARKMGIDERISTYRTTYSSGNAPRVNNIHILGDALDGTLVEPGGTFSFNAAVGERTAAKGYREANAIVKGKLVPQLGGGICQVATTLFNTVFLSGFPVTQRANHSFYISHYPTGRDATVSWGGPDLRWKNPTSKWVLVAVGYTNSSITVSLYGTDPGYDVSYTTGPFTNIVPYKTEKVSDPTLDDGVKAVEDPGVDGRRVVVKRTVMRNGEVVRETSFTSKYSPKTEVVRVGTKKPSSKTATPTP